MGIPDRIIAYHQDVPVVCGGTIHGTHNVYGYAGERELNDLKRLQRTQAHLPGAGQLTFWTRLAIDQDIRVKTWPVIPGRDPFVIYVLALLRCPAHAIL